MKTLEKLMKTGDDLVSRHMFPGPPDWQSLYDATPDDAEDGEEDNGPEDAPDAEDVANSSNAADAAATGMQGLRAALAKDLQPLGDALFAAWQTGDLPAMTAALKKISMNMPALAGDAANLSDELAKSMADAYMGTPASK